MLFSGTHGALRIGACWGGTQDFAARAICSFGSLDVSGVETLVVENHGGAHQYLTQALRSLTTLRSLRVSLFHHAAAPLCALRQEGTSPLLRHFSMDLFGTLVQGLVHRIYGGHRDEGKALGSQLISSR